MKAGWTIVQLSTKKNPRRQLREGSELLPNLWQVPGLRLPLPFHVGTSETPGEENHSCSQDLSLRGGLRNKLPSAKQALPSWVYPPCTAVQDKGMAVPAEMGSEDKRPSVAPGPDPGHRLRQCTLRKMIGEPAKPPLFPSVGTHCRAPSLLWTPTLDGFHR